MALLPINGRTQSSCRNSFSVRPIASRERNSATILCISNFGLRSCPCRLVKAAAIQVSMSKVATKSKCLIRLGSKAKTMNAAASTKSASPKVNMCYPPLRWQTYDIDFTAAKWDGDKKVANARITVRHNGVVIHKDLELPKHTPGRHGENAEPDSLFLQDHGNPVTFRNIWIVKKVGRCAFCVECTVWRCRAQGVDFKELSGRRILTEEQAIETRKKLMARWPKKIRTTVFTYATIFICFPLLCLLAYLWVSGKI